MTVNFKYSYILDLVFHVFAHIKVNNASDLYDGSYEFDTDLTRYYNENFNRLAIIQFMLTDAKTIDDVADILLNKFNEYDKQFFILPFIAILRREDKTYRAQWDRIKPDTTIETAIAKKFNEFAFDKDINIYLSHSLTRYGRGIYSPDKYQAVVPFSYDTEHCFYMALHEITHQITDKLLNSDINMDDGSHDLSESVAIMADYHWLNDKESYLRWISKIIGSDVILTADMFENIFKIPKIINDKILRECINK
jgi:hypothetical protein